MERSRKDERVHDNMERTSKDETYLVQQESLEKIN